MEAGRKEEIKKGPWKAEEDEVLINHVKRYGPRDWSSIRSKGLLQRTGKSCRLRWVNKLRPNLKNGCKFSAEEERTVIELQSEFGNKWARIATYLPGRTDNDVKNFWSSRTKRLARILHNNNNSDASSSSFTPKSSSHRSKGKNVKPLQSFKPPQVEEEITASSSSSKIPVPYSSDRVDETMRSDLQPFTFGTGGLALAETTTTATMTPLFSDSLIPNQQPLAPFSPDSRDLLARFDDFYGILGPEDSSEPLFALPQPFFEPSPPPRRYRHVSRDDDEHSDVFFDDFPADMFDPVPSPSP
ncbi:unnamed protein product [Microthlaspi erraticum]|uniref:Uncharacterized protein n=1 Tax=Microthlaspi erraticum TaxID=1685480 RepID=A0A6D2IR12_9BRAS|nr:unnamed protein product [Microthlaspi erraticum]